MPMRFMLKQKEDGLAYGMMSLKKGLGVNGRLTMAFIWMWIQ